MKRSPFVTVGAWLLVASVCGADGDSRPATPDKSNGESKSFQGDYPLTSKNGPWMVMVKSFKGPDAIKIANELARELRQEHKIPAYTVVRRADDWRSELGAITPEGRVRTADSSAVLAGDCKDEKTAAKLQEKIQEIRPKAITFDMVPVYQWQYGALRTAFCLPNPLAPAPRATQKADPLVAKWNAGKHTIFRCPGEYTLQAMVFSGGVAYTPEEAKKLEKSKLLAAAGDRAEQVAAMLRKQGVDAYTYHTRTDSMVTVGAFGSPQDPQINDMRKQIAGKVVGEFVMVTEPQLMEVPHK